MGKFYATTAIDYPSGKPHLGHAYEKACADCIARWNRLQGKETFFLTGTDEHGKKIAKKAEEAKLKPKEFVDLQVKDFQELCKKWNISIDRFIRTTEPKHEKMCQEIFQKVLDKGEIFKGTYEGLYCTDCEAYYLEKDLVGGKCPVHEKPCESLKEESYFFKMSKYQKQLEKLFEENKDFVLPKTRRNEVLNRIKQGLKDLSVSRTSIKWGIQLPNDKKHVIYVWFDALLNYLSGINYPSKEFNKFWPADVQLIGKDILWFHSVIWPCILMSAGIKPPKTIFVHGFINTDTGNKMAKSHGTVIDPIELAGKYNIDSVRYFLLREIPFGEDGNFSFKALHARNNNELVNGLGNLLNRSLSLIEKKCDGKIPEAKVDKNLEKKLELEKIKKYMDEFELHLALAEIMKFVAACNKYVNDQKPWKQSKKECDKTLYNLADSLRIIAILIEPFMPSTTEKINKQLGCNKCFLKDCKFGLLKSGTKIRKEGFLFTKIEE